MKMYAGSMYGFCEVCRKTDVPTTLERDDLVEIVCPTCMEAECDEAESILPDVCSFRGCANVAVTICAKCLDAICTFHENKDGQCDVCSPLMRSNYSKGWSSDY